MRWLWLTAALFNLGTALIHTIMGQLEFVNPMLAMEYDALLKGIFHACWHMITVFLFSTTILYSVLIFDPKKSFARFFGLFSGSLYTAFAIIFGVMSLFYGEFLAQWTILLPTGIVSLIAARKSKSSAA